VRVVPCVHGGGKRKKNEDFWCKLLDPIICTGGSMSDRESVPVFFFQHFANDDLAHVVTPPRFLLREGISTPTTAIGPAVSTAHRRATVFPSTRVCNVDRSSG
jgi:hypothetical protein